MGAMYVRHNVRTSNCKLRSLQSACRCGLCVLLHTDKIQQERSKNAPKLGQTIKYFMCLWLKLMHVISVAFHLEEKIICLLGAKNFSLRDKVLAWPIRGEIKNIS